MIKKASTLLLTCLMTASLAACSSPSGPPEITTVTITENGDSNPTAVMETNWGTIELEIFTNEIPEIGKNFVELAKEGKYDGTAFHRIVPNFVIQGGDFENGDGTGGHSYKGPGTYLPGEFADGISNVRGTISMANRGPNTNGSQFFINLVDNIGLDNDQPPLSSQHPVFGKVIKGMEVVDKIGNYQPSN